MAILSRAIVRTLPAVPKPIVRKISERYIAGTRVEDACRVVKRLNGEAKMATIDVLGEEITTWEEARHIGYEYENVFRTIDEQGLDSNVSVKLTGLGLKLDHGLCREILERLVRQAAERRNFVRIDMEDSSCTDETLRLYRELREAGLENVGIVLQAYLRRTLDDIEALSDLTPNVRLCKGIYVEPEEIAYQGFDEVRENFVRALGALLERRLLRGDRDARRMADRRRRATRSRGGALPGRVRVSDAAGGPATAGHAARRAGTPAAHLRPVRRGVVRLLAAPTAGEPEDRGLHRVRHARAAAPEPQRSLSFRRYALERVGSALVLFWLAVTGVYLMLHLGLGPPRPSHLRDPSFRRF